MSPHEAMFAAAARAWTAYLRPIKKVENFWWSNLASLSLSPRATADVIPRRSPLSAWQRTASCVSECIAPRSLSSTVTSACCFSTCTAFLSVLLSMSSGIAVVSRSSILRSAESEASPSPDS
jgi:hypothetical protein